MPIPANLTTVTVTGTYSNVSGVSPTGTVTFIPTQWLRDTDGDTIIPVLPHTSTLTSGSFSASLVATDNEDIDQVWAYRVVETIDGAVNTFTALLPASLVSVSMADLVPVTSDPEYFSLQGPRGEQGVQGVQGETGPQGPQGDPTTVNGKTGASITLNAADVGAVANSVFTDKGSLVAASGSATPADLPVGSDGQVLVADSGETVGVRWGDFPHASSHQSGGSDPLTLSALQIQGSTFDMRVFASSPRWYYNHHGSTANRSISTNVIIFMPFVLTSAADMTGLTCEIAVAGSGSAALRLGLYDDDSGVPGGLVYDAGTVAAATTGVKTITFSAEPLSVGLYWLALAVEDATGSPRPTSRSDLGRMMGAISTRPMNPVTAMVLAYTPGGLPATGSGAALATTQTEYVMGILLEAQ